MLSFFTIRDQLVAQQKHLLRVEEMQHADWLICLVGIQDVGITINLLQQVEGLMKNEQQIQTLLLKVDPGSTLSSNFLQPETNVFVARQVDHAR